MLVTVLKKKDKYYYRRARIKNIRIKPLTSYSGSYWNLMNIRYYDLKGNLLPVTNVTKISTNKATFKLNGIPVTIELKGTVYSASYDISCIFTNTGYGMIVTGLNGDYGLYYTFETPMYIGKIVSSTHSNAGYNMKDFQVLANNETRLLYEGIAPNQGTANIVMQFS